MNKQIAICNRICFYQDLKRAWDIHESKVTNQGCMVDCQSPQTLTLRSNQTFRGLLTNRREEIERENNFLLKKLLNINENSRVKRKDIKKVRNLPNLCQINKIQRQYKIREIQKQNDLMNSRLSCNIKQSNYSARAFINDRQKTQNYINLRSRFPYKNSKKNKSAVKFEMKNSPNKYNSMHSQYRQGKYLTQQNFQSKSAEILSVFNGTRYKIIGDYNAEGLIITIRNTHNPQDKHTLKVDQKQSSDLLKNSYCGSLKIMLQSVSFDSKNQHFFIKLPEIPDSEQF